MYKTRGQRDPAYAVPLASRRDDADVRRQANRTVAVIAARLAVTGPAELLPAVLTGSVRLLESTLQRITGQWLRRAVARAAEQDRGHLGHAGV